MTSPSVARRKCANPACRVEFWPRHGAQTYHAEWCRIVARYARRSDHSAATENKVAASPKKSPMDEAYARGVAAGREEYSTEVGNLNLVISQLRQVLSTRLEGDAALQEQLNDEHSRSDALTAALVDVRRVRDQLHREVAALKKDVDALQGIFNDERRLRITADDRVLVLEKELYRAKEELSRLRAKKTSNLAGKSATFSMIGTSLPRKAYLSRDKVVSVEIVSGNVPSSMTDNNSW